MSEPSSDRSVWTFYKEQDVQPAVVGTPVYAIDEETGEATVVAHVSHVDEDGTVTVTGGKPGA